MDVHDPRNHTKAIGGLAAAIAVMGLYGAHIVQTIPAKGPTAIIPRAAIVVDASLSSALAGLSKEPVEIYCVPTSCALADSFAEAFTAAGWQAKTLDALGASPGIWVKASAPDADKIAAAIEAATKVTARVDPGLEGGGLEIVVGRIPKR